MKQGRAGVTELVNEILKVFLITSVCYLIFIKIINIKFNFSQKFLIGIGFVVLTEIILLLCKNVINEPYKTAILILISSVFLSIISRERFEVILTAFILSYAVSYILFAFAITISAVILDQFEIFGNSVFIYIMACIWDIVFLALLSKVKTNINVLLKKGVGGIGLIICGIVFIFYSLFREDITYKSFWLMMVGVALTGYGIFYWWKRETVIAHNDKVNEIINKRLQIQLDEKTDDNEKLQKAHDYLASTVHKDDKTLDALQRAIENIIKNSKQPETLMNSRIILAEINVHKRQLSTDFSKNVHNGRVIPSTGLLLLDAKFEILLEEAVESNIDFDLKINGKVKGLVQIIPQIDLINIISDLVKNAFIAIKHTELTNTYRSVLINIGMIEDEYELRVEDSGIHFDINTLINLGKQKTTTHADTGGSGIGFMTVFEIMNKTDASIIIDEYSSNPNGYSKAVTIRCDDKNEYTIRSYRAYEIKASCEDGHNIIILNS